MGITEKMDDNVFEDKHLHVSLDECIQTALSRKSLNLCGALIKGHSGTGKTFFVENYLEKLEAVHPILIARHNPQQESIPYAGFRFCVADFINNAYKTFSKKKYETFSFALRERLGENFNLFCDYIPELEILIGKGATDQSSCNPKTENQTYPLFKLLFGFLSDFYKKPVLIFTDDLQYMDGSGINLLKYLLLHLAPHQLIWIGAYRETQRNLVQINQLIESLNFDKKYIETISTKEFTPIQSHYFMERWLGGICSPELSRICHQLSMANLSQLQVLVESLKKEGLIHLNRSVWEGDYHHIIKKYQGQNAYQIVVERLNQLSIQVKEMVYLTTCIGGFNRRLLLGYFQENEYLYNACVEEVVQCGLWVLEDEAYHFSESHIGQMIYESMSGEQRSHFHYQIAKLLYQKDPNRLSYSKQIMMAGHFNQALELVRKHEELALCADLNYRAGYLHHQDQVFDQAKLHYKISADLYKECPWDKVSYQTREVYMQRAKVEYALGEYDLAEIHLDYLLDQFADPIQRAEVFELKVIINSHLGRYRKVVSILNECLPEFGLDLPLEEKNLLHEIAFLKIKLAQQERTAFPSFSLPPKEDQNAILQLLSVGGMALHHTSDILMTWAALQIVVRSQNNHAAVRGIGYVSYGRMCIISGDIRKGFELGKKGLDDNISQNDFQYRCRIFGVFAFYIQPWQSAFSDSLPLLQEGMHAGRKTGDLIGLYILKTHQFNLHFISGRPLPELLKYDFEELYTGRELTYYITHYQKSLVRFLTGETVVFSIPRQQPSTLAASLTIQEEKFYRNHVWARYYFLMGHYELAVQYGKDAHHNKKLQEGSPLIPSNLQMTFLSITQNWHNWCTNEKLGFGEELQEILRQADLWTEHAPMNYSASSYLLYAEWYRIQGNANEIAEEYFYKAISTAGTNTYLKALSQELLGKYYLSGKQQVEEGKHHLRLAIDQYKRWGGTAKSRQLVQQYHFLLMDIFPRKEELDVEAILRELSGDLHFKSLIKKLMVLLLRVSGSTRAAVDWMESIESKGTESLSLIPSCAEKHIPSGLMVMAHRTQEMFLNNDLSQESPLSEPALLREQGVKSFIIFPITLSDSFSMTIYLQNDFISSCYQKEKIKWIRVTANQGAIVLENAKTHERTVKLNEKLQQEIAEKELLAAQIENHKDEHLKQLIATQEKERKRISGDLHDSLGALLSSIKLRFIGFQETSLQNDFEKQERYQAMLAQIDDAVEEVRRIAHNMSPVTLRRFGLTNALQSLVEQINHGSQLEAEIQILGLDKRLPEELELTVYRICQELVQNVIKHAHGNRLRLQIINHLDLLNIVVEDNGIGMELAKITTGFGWAGIQTKSRLLQGRFSIESQPGKGCTAIVDIPLNRPPFQNIV